MTRHEAVLTVLCTRSRVLDRLRDHRPQWMCDALQTEAAEDTVDLLIALGVLKVDAPSPQDGKEARQDD